MSPKDQWILDALKSGRYSISQEGVVTSNRLYGYDGKVGVIGGFAQASELKKLAIEAVLTQKEIASMFGIEQSKVSRIKSGIRRSAA